MQPNDFNQPTGPTFPQQQPPQAGQPRGDGQTQEPQNLADVQQVQRISQLLAGAKQQLSGVPENEEAAMLHRAFEQVKDEPPTTEAPPEPAEPVSSGTEGELIIRPQQPNGNEKWNGDNNGNSN